MPPKFDWTPALHDLTLRGVSVSAAYLAAAWLSWRARATIAADASFRLGLFWLLTAGGLAMLGLNKQLDLQTLIIQVGREIALAQGWYEQRRAVQAAFLAAAAISGLTLAWLGLALIRKQWAQLKWALAGIGLIAAYLGTRAAEITHVGFWQGRLSSDDFFLLELAGAALIAWQAARPAGKKERGGAGTNSATIAQGK